MALVSYCAVYLREAGESAAYMLYILKFIKKLMLRSSFRRFPGILFYCISLRCSAMQNSIDSTFSPTTDLTNRVVIVFPGIVHV